MNKQTLQFKLIRGFLLILIPLALFLFYNNYYAMSVVREEVSKSISRAISLLVTQMDKALEESNYYLLRQVSAETSYSDLIALSLYAAESGEYFLAKQSILRKFSSDLNAYKAVDTFFAYSAKNDELIATQRDYESTQRNEKLVRSFLHNTSQPSAQEWVSMVFENKSYLIRLVQANPGVFVGAIIDAQQLIAPLQSLDAENQLKPILLSKEGTPLTPNSLSPENWTEIDKLLHKEGSTYQVFTDVSDKQHYLLVASEFQWAPIRVIALIPERDKLRNLPFFQYVIALIPVGALVLLYFYSIFLKRVLLAPMKDMIKGMRKIMQGDFEIHLADNHSTEFKFLIETFNKMVSQIRHLKINVYEEMLKTQSAEFKHLQAQINPHFYLNSLHIIYSLSVLNENALVQKMTEHLADYFRFITRSHRETIMLEEELKHIGNYLEIQKLRFPEKLTYAMQVPEHFHTWPILPLTIQPFVENAIVHGMEKGKAVFHVEITVSPIESNPELLEITIADNGRGFREELLEKVQLGDYGEGTSAHHLGIWNVHHRLRLKYGKRVDLTLTNLDPKGALVRLQIPRETDEQGGSDEHEPVSGG